jgi:hypothetical protein
MRDANLRAQPPAAEDLLTLGSAATFAFRGRRGTRILAVSRLGSGPRHDNVRDDTGRRPRLSGTPSTVALFRVRIEMSTENPRRQRYPLPATTEVGG